MTRVLLVTNDFPPTLGGIQSYLRDFVDTLPAEDLVVFASVQDAEAARAWDARQPYKVIRWPVKMMLPTLATARRMQEIIREEKIDTVWLGASAPLALMASWAKKAGAKRVVASTHGHEVGWSMLPGARQALKIIGRDCDAITYIAEYTLGRFARAFGGRRKFVHLPSGVSVTDFVPVAEEERERLRSELGWEGEGPFIVCISRLVPRKGQDRLIEALPEVLRAFPNAQLVLVGGGSYEKRLRELAQGLEDHVSFLGRVDDDVMKKAMQAATVFAMPARTRGKGLDVEGLGIVYLEAQACGIPVLAGDSGGAPETVTPESGVVVRGNDVEAIADALKRILSDPAAARQMGMAGRRNVEKRWTWEIMGKRLRDVLSVN
ncbi:glycosyltransferase family 4 protein [Corynebacterium vitaeruminis]|uniref:glycosyltransferase family 4 protein n=1 Tax=Corynebacterium vitaeruminis TaxID=38305 RepID=UPI00055264AF|nr:glycosyltransferase family 4 protein [Corynebacterium vitaeruminis]